MLHKICFVIHSWVVPKRIIVIIIIIVIFIICLWFIIAADLKILAKTNEMGENCIFKNLKAYIMILMLICHICLICVLFEELNKSRNLWWAPSNVHRYFWNKLLSLVNIKWKMLNKWILSYIVFVIVKIDTSMFLKSIL